MKKKKMNFQTQEGVHGMALLLQVAKSLDIQSFEADTSYEDPWEPFERCQVIVAASLDWK